VHRVDADLARGAEPSVDGAIAADGIGELLDNIPTARYFRPRVAELRGDGESIGLHSTDRDESWHIRLVADGLEWQPVEADATVTVSAPTSMLYLVVFGRLPATDRRVEVTGDGALLARWLECSAL
jgi:MDMPI C-terminal domain